ncbi:MAG: carbohydrate ABC transporter permease [Granulosicoccus sp.]
MMPGVRERRENAQLATPLLLFLLAFLGFPAVVDLVYSVSQVSFENLRAPTFAGLENYRAVLDDPGFWQAFGFSMRFGLITALLEVMFGLALAVYLAPLFTRRPWLLAILMMPMMVAPAMVGLMYRLVLHEFVGPVPYYLYAWFGDSPSFLGPDQVFTTLVTIEVLQWTPFALLLCYLAWQSVPEQIREAAAIDGAKGWRQFRHIDWPLMRPTIAVAFFIRFIDGFRVFDNIYVLTGSGAGGNTTSLSIYIYLAFFRAGDIGRAVAASVLLFVAAFALIVLPAWLAKRISTIKSGRSE